VYRNDEISRSDPSDNWKRKLLGVEEDGDLVVTFKMRVFEKMKMKNACIFEFLKLQQTRRK